MVIVSHPARGAWIETISVIPEFMEKVGRTPPGVRGLKHFPLHRLYYLVSRTPPGVRGLKHERGRDAVFSKASHPARGAWIETLRTRWTRIALCSRTPPGGAWIETFIWTFEL